MRCRNLIESTSNSTEASRPAQASCARQIRSTEREAAELSGQEGQAAELRIARERLRALDDELGRLRMSKADAEREADRLRCARRPRSQREVELSDPRSVDRRGFS